MDPIRVYMDSLLVQQDSRWVQMDSRWVQQDSRWVHLDSKPVHLDSKPVQMDPPEYQRRCLPRVHIFVGGKRVPRMGEVHDMFYYFGFPGRSYCVFL